MKEHTIPFWLLGSSGVHRHNTWLALGAFTIFTAYTAQTTFTTYTYTVYEHHILFQLLESSWVEKYSTWWALSVLWSLCSEDEIIPLTQFNICSAKSQEEKGIFNPIYPRGGAHCAPPVTYLRISVQIRVRARWKNLTFLSYEFGKGQYTFYPVKLSRFLEKK